MTYRSNRLDGNSVGAAADFDRLFSELCHRIGREPYQETLAGAGKVGRRMAVVQLRHEQGRVSVRKGVQITFPDDPSIVYFFGDGAHIVTVDLKTGEFLAHEVKRDQEASELMIDLLTSGCPN